MTCTHKRLKCTNNIYYCLDCGAVVPDPFQPEPVPVPDLESDPVSDLEPDPEPDPGPVVPEKPKKTRKAAAKK